MKKIVLGLALTLFIVLFVSFYWATEPARQQAAALRQTREAAEVGAEIYVKTCAGCHGSRGEGRVGPALKGTRLDEQVLRRVISLGKPGTPMPAFGQEDGGPLKSHDIAYVVTFIRNWDASTLEEAAAHVPTPDAPPPAASPSPGGAAPVPASAPPALLEGRSIFEKSCAACHPLPTAEQVKKFTSDESMVAIATVMARQMANLDGPSADKVVRYLLALRRGAAP